MSIKRKLVVGVTAVAVAAFAGGAYAATQDSGANSRQAFLNDVAKRLHVSPQQLTSALQGATIDQLNAEVKSGRLTQAQANALKQRIQKGQALGLPGFFFAAPGLLYGRPGFGPGGYAVPVPGLGGFAPPAFKRAYGPPFAGPRGFGPRGLIPFGPITTYRTAASYLGLSQPALFKQLAAGKTLAQIATARGKSLSGLESALTSAAKARLEAAVKAKLITQAEAQKEISRLPALIAAQVKRTGPPFAPGMVVAPAPGKAGPVPMFRKGAPVPGAPVPGPKAGAALNQLFTQPSGPA